MSERFVLKPVKRGSQRGWVAIERQVPDHDFDPPFWVSAGEIGRFPDRESARLFMQARSETPSPNPNTKAA